MAGFILNLYTLQLGMIAHYVMDILVKIYFFKTNFGFNFCYGHLYQIFSTTLLSQFSHILNINYLKAYYHNVPPGAFFIHFMCLFFKHHNIYFCQRNMRPKGPESLIARE